jgi:hypothetical protein
MRKKRVYLTDEAGSLRPNRKADEKQNQFNFTLNVSVNNEQITNHQFDCQL